MRTEPDHARPLWARPLAWLGIGVAITIVGMLILPRWFGFAFLFLPLIWIGGSRRRIDRS